jgi:hypothetical protein
MNLVNQSDGSIAQILIIKNMRKKVFNYFAKIISSGIEIKLGEMSILLNSFSKLVHRQSHGILKVQNIS